MFKLAVGVFSKDRLVFYWMCYNTFCILEEGCLLF